MALATLIATIGSLGLAGPPAITPRVLAATPELTVVGATRYDIQPDAGRVLVTVDLTVTNQATDTATTRYFYDRAFLTVPPGAASFTVSGGIGRPDVTVTETKPTYQLLAIDFGGRLGAAASTKLRLAFELPDAGEPPDRELRVTRTLVTLPAWALASTGTPGSSVTVSVPDDYTVSFLRGSLNGPTRDDKGVRVWTSTPIDDPLTFDLYVRADRPPVFAAEPLSIAVDGGTARLTVRSWTDDAAWLGRMEDLFRRGVPRLAAAIGRPWPLSEPLTVQESLNPPTEGIAGSFDPASHQIEVIYSAGPEIALHEAAHVWFNGGLLADRWANEAFASYYAEQVARELGVPFDPVVLTPEVQAGAVPLNAWAAGDVPPVAGAERSAIEAYGYAASAELARQIATEIGPAGLQRVWAAIGDGVAPYQPPGGPTELLTGPPDWRGLLDLLEDDGTTRVAGLWAVRVVRAEEAGMLGERTVARRAYAEALERVGDWRLPRTIRDAMRAWQFGEAGKQLAAAATALDARDVLAAAALTTGLAVPASLRTRFEEASDLSSVELLIRAEAEAAVAIEAAMVARPPETGILEWIGLLGARPDESLSTAVAAFGSADPVTAKVWASEAEAAWLGAAAAGRLRLALITGGIAFVLVLAFIVMRRRRSETGGGS